MNWWEEQSEPASEKPMNKWWEEQSSPVAAPEKKQTRRGSRYVKPFIQRVSEAAGVPVLPESDLSFMERADIGLGDTLEERRQKFLSMYPAGTYEEVSSGGKRKEGIYTKSPLEPARLVNEPGLTAMDIANRPQEMATLPLQAGAAVLGPVGLGAQALLQAAIPGVVHLGKESIEQIRGFQEQPVRDVLGTAAGESITELLPSIFGAGIGAGVRRLRGPAEASPEGLARDVEAIEQMKALGGAEAQLPDPMLYQIRPDIPIISRLGAQMRSTSPRAIKREAEQAKAFEDVLNQYQTISLGSAGATLERTGRDVFKRRREDIRRSFGLNAEVAGKAIKGIFTEDFERKSRSAINEAYKEAGNLAQGVSFDLSSAQKIARTVTAPVEGLPIIRSADEVADLVNVKADPDGAVRRVSGLLQQLDPYQTDWRVIKELRSQVGDAIKSPELSDVSSGQAKAIYRSLTNVMESPSGGNDAFVEAWRNANKLASERFKVYEDSRVLKILKEDSPARIAFAVGTNPMDMNPTIRSVINNFSPDKKQTVRNAVGATIVGDNNNSRAMLQKWQDQNPAAYEFLFPSANDKAAIETAALAMDELRKSPIAKMMDVSIAKINRGKQILSNLGPEEVRSVVKQLGGNNSEAGQALRLASFNDILSKVITSNKDGLPTVNATALEKAIKQSQDSGVWDNVLTNQDKIKIKGISAYTRRVFKNMMDTGTSLEQAQAVAQLKHPGTFLQGLHALLVNNRVLPLILMNDKLAKHFKPKRTRARGPGGRVSATFPFIANFAAELARISESEVGR